MSGIPSQYHRYQPRIAVAISSEGLFAAKVAIERSSEILNEVKDQMPRATAIKIAQRLYSNKLALMAMEGPRQGQKR